MAPESDRHESMIPSSESPTVPRRVSLRRGSISASDPYGAHSELNLNPLRTTSSKLTIVRVNDPHTNNHEPEPTQRSPSPLNFQNRNRNHKRHGSNSSVGSTGSESNRLSFAFSTFGPANPNSRPVSPSTTRQPQRPGSPSRRRNSFTRTRLAPEQVIELARSATHPKLNQSSPNVASSQYPISQSLSAPNFTPLPDDVYLPFVDRPAEVSTLITSPPCAKLFTLLSQTFPHDARQSCATVTSPDFINTDPKQWNYAQLEYFFKFVDRDLVSDEEWAGKARACIISHSELIWERIKGALGVPPELDLSEDEQHRTVGRNEEEPVTASQSNFGISVEDPAPPIEAGPSPSHTSSGSLTDETPPLSPSTISIEPVFAMEPNEPIPGDAMSLGDITEDMEEEGENLDDVTAYPSPNSPNANDTVQGLRICTSNSSPHIMAYSSPMFSNISPLASPAISSIGREFVPEDFKLKRSGSSSSSLYGESPGVSNLSSYFTYHDVHDDPYHAIPERGPGNPLFPSNFAHLAMGPTLRANNPSVRRQVHPPHPAFSNPHAIRTGIGRARRGVPSWAGSWDGKLSEYAVTTGSASSVVGEA